MSTATRAIRSELVAYFAAMYSVLAGVAGSLKWEAEFHAPDHPLLTNDRGQSNLVGLFIGLLIAGIVAIQVFIPVINDAIASSNVSGTTKDVLELLGLFAGLLLLVALAAPLMRRI